MPHELRLGAINSLLKPNGISNPALCHALEEIERETFYPDISLSLIYSDASLPLSKGRSALSFFALAMILEAAEIEHMHKVLILGVEKGYAAVVCAQLTHNVIALESDPNLFETLEKNIDSLQTPEISIVHADISKGHSLEAPYDCILILGATDKAPSILFDQLSAKGKLLHFETDEDTLCHLVVYQKLNASLHKRVLAAAPAPKLLMLEEKGSFSL